MDLRKKEEISKKKCFSSLMEGKREMSKIRLLKGIDLENQASIEEDIYQDEELIRVYEKRKKDNQKGLMEIERQKDQRKVWVNVDNLFVQQKVEETKRCIKEDQEYLESEIKKVKERIDCQKKKLKILQNKMNTGYNDFND
ncbi:uncharacterized protein T551_03491 [Pneumocystis jirovecii RU7]|uniref:Uncharacterized protein n=1 Tax=Pneumocystis jirovecii (strain RU7) TaxID=1408657 RepID=A0A0W4ZE28_PNEJ7|nr:uncharacterized protein T551_03491 [Pneumocystis jirovecii RU7]KTW26574.1 hypothetical protein T551_03491 [Pneumocystis jirovecii RU7]